MVLLYSIAIRLYTIIAHVLSPFNAKAAKWVKGRKNWQKKLPNFNSEDKIYWFHCASLGEYLQGEPLMKQLKRTNANIKLVISFFSPSGYEQKKNEVFLDSVLYLPIDTPRNAKAFIKAINPTQAFFIKYEFWYYYFKELNKYKVPFYIVSATFRKNQLFFKRYGGFYRKILQLPTQIFVQNKESKQLLKTINIDSIVSGDTRYDKVTENANKAIKNKLIEQFKHKSFTVILGSSWQPEEELFQKIYDYSYKLIIAPHDVSKKHIMELMQRFPKAITYSQLKKTEVKVSNVLIIDSVGILSNTYQYADVSVVGGGFSGALHNILEPACFGLPVFFGPIHNKFPEADDMIKNGAGFNITNPIELKISIQELKENKQKLKELKQINLNFIKNRVGATDRIIESVKANF